MPRRLMSALTSRWLVKGGFLALFIWLASRLLAFAEWARGTGPYVKRPEAVAGILPVGHFTSFFAWVKGGGWDTLLPAGLVIICGALGLSLLFKRGFCGWVCPVGTVWEIAQAVGKRLTGSTVRVPRPVDIAGRVLRYALALAFFWFVARVSVPEALWFRQLPYMWVADIKIIEGFGTPLFLAVVALVFVVSMLLGAVWCRYLCPLGALYSIVGMASPCAVTRDEATCIHCSRCTTACHAFVDVERASTVRSAECDGCMDCVKACPVDGCLEPRVAGRWRIPSWAWGYLVASVWFAVYLAAKLTGNWDTTIPVELFRQVIGSGLLEQTTRFF